MLDVVKNKRLKMSPAGVINLPVAARKALGMKPGVGAVVGIAAKGDGITLTGTPAKEAATLRVSRRGQAVLPEAGRACLDKAQKRHYWVELNDAKQTAVLKPY
jgi:bifunctional DNA-binding transcriptional regulator/antitoxin component of YhaV-PrlF toxin-antitoxin module